MIEYILLNESKNKYTLNINNKIITLLPNQSVSLNSVKNLNSTLKNLKGLKITTTEIDKTISEIKEKSKNKKETKKD